MWRMCNNVLPTLINLHLRNIVPSPSCAQCHNFPEDSLHAVWYCEAITGAWSTLEWLHQTAPPHPTSFSELLACFLFCREEFRAEPFVIIVWLLWNRRNAIHLVAPLCSWIVYAVKQAATSKNFCKLRLRSLSHLVLLPCNSGALRIFIV